MANWASSSYAIEGSKTSLDKIYQAILHPIIEKDSHESWEGNVLKALGISWEPRKYNESSKSFSGLYMRGFIQDEPWFDNNGALRFDAEEAWGITDFYKVLEENLPDIKVYWVVEESGMEIYCTNDVEGKYFPDRYYADICIDGNYYFEYFTAEEYVYKWLADKTNNRIKSKEDVESFNADYEDSEASDENFIYIHKFDIEK